MAVDRNRKFEALPYLCLSTLPNLKIYELEAEREGCISRCSEIDEKMCPGRKKVNLSEFILHLCFTCVYVYNSVLRISEHENHIVNYGRMTLTLLTCGGQQKLSGLLLSYSLVYHYALTIGHIYYSLFLNGRNSLSQSTLDALQKH
jgi:hypothetical protein